MNSSRTWTPSHFQSAPLFLATPLPLSLVSFSSELSQYFFPQSRIPFYFIFIYMSLRPQSSSPKTFNFVDLLICFALSFSCSIAYHQVTGFVFPTPLRIGSFFQSSPPGHLEGHSFHSLLRPLPPRKLIYRQV